MPGEKSCVFCTLNDKEMIGENELCAAFRDKYPVTPGHTLIIPRRHIEDILEASEAELISLFALVKEVRDKLSKECDTGDFTLLVNYGKSAGQTIPHMHIHCLPRS